jgi:hypothetical protein
MQPEHGWLKIAAEVMFLRDNLAPLATIQAFYADPYLGTAHPYDITTEHETDNRKFRCTRSPLSGEKQEPVYFDTLREVLDYADQPLDLGARLEANCLWLFRTAPAPGPYMQLWLTATR